MSNEQKKNASSRDVLAAALSVVQALEDHFCEFGDTTYRTDLAVAALHAAIISVSGKPVTG